MVKQKSKINGDYIRRILTRNPSCQLGELISDLRTCNSLIQISVHFLRSELTKIKRFYFGKFQHRSPGKPEFVTGNPYEAEIDAALLNTKKGSLNYLTV
ncbi:hypothetical protein M514_01143 [Trichuris suis]|uniref:Uncharacterized protein n=1 Tax=Trichuris suis TaxID=68888 RepID=A0A085ML14_9BILA|nr:hypothetical protein M513_01143 [Trichuris suis]KFD70916.1 hypothetical protein M514_01143 [Trichuris suis]